MQELIALACVILRGVIVELGHGGVIYTLGTSDLGGHSCQGASDTG